ncbi:MAG: putative DNA-binding domain-containing protein [Acidobacteria bacterium]|nr:putative DNA-binding domain-containing protein [Acidobacteriota bacterium]
MPTLADIQHAVRQAILDGLASDVEPFLVGGKEPGKRLEIHRRHYETSLVKALLGKFPATEWLVGSTYLAEAGRRYVRQFPPQDPCIAVYGRTFPRYLSRLPGSARLPYLREFMELEWHVGQVSIALTRPAIPIQEVAGIRTEVLPEAALVLEPGARYLYASWPVDELLRYYLTGTAPDRLVFEPAEVWLEIRGARGDFQINRLEPADFIFRRTLSEGHSIAAATEQALGSIPNFEPSGALARLFAAGLVTEITVPRKEVFTNAF